MRFNTEVWLLKTCDCGSVRKMNYGLSINYLARFFQIM